MSTANIEQVSIFEFGRMTGVLESMSRQMQEFNERIIFRTDNLETRIEVLEKASTKGNVWMDIFERVLWGAGGVLSVMALKGQGII